MLPAKGHITTDERSLIRDNIILLMMLDMIEHNRKQIENSGNLMKPMFLATTDRLTAIVNADALAIKRQLQSAKVKWWEEAVTNDNFILRYKYICRGYEGDFGMTRDVARSQLSIKFGEYFARMNGMLKPRSAMQAGSNASRTV